MTALATDVVVTGMAWSTPLGNDLEGTWQRLCDGRTGIAPVPSPHPLRSGLAAVVDSIPYGANSGERQHLLTTRTATAAFTDAGLGPDDREATLVLGTSFGDALDEPGTGPLHAWADRAADEIGHPGQPLCVMTACSAGADGVAIAEALIRAGRSRICVVGGVDVVTEAKRLGHSALGTMSPTGLRTFDRDHDGMILGEGAGFVVLESRESARARGAVPRARLRGTGSANDATGLTAPDPSGRSVCLAIRRCLANSGATASDVDAVGVHGTGTVLNDQVEAASLQTLFGDSGAGPVVFGTKGALGHSLGASGAIEAISTVLALRDRTVPPLAGLRQPVPGLSLRLPIDRARPIDGDTGISITLGFGGFNTCLMFDEAEAGR